MVERHHTIQFDLDAHDPEALAEALADAIGRASRRRTLARLGSTAIALSGGLDSRTLLCTADDPSALQTFCCFDDENREVRTARRIAEAMAVPFLPYHRAFEHYGDSADAGVAISGGMGDLGNNHFLACRDALAGHGVETLVTGCYFDYLFKSLALDTVVHPFTRVEAAGPTRASTYHQHFDFSGAWAEGVAARREALLPRELREDGGEWARRERAARRTFPLAREGDNQSRLVPLRVMGWSAPAIDLDLLDVYRRIPVALRLNRRVFHAAVARSCTPEVARIMDVNTGLRVGAPQWAVSGWRYVLALRHRIEEVRSSIMTEGSWPNWHYYVQRSTALKHIWERENPAATEALRALLGSSWSPALSGYRSVGGELPLRVLTLKSWMDQRAGVVR